MFLYIAGVVVTILISKTSDKIFPEDTFVIKEVTDTIKIVHEYKIPKDINEDSTRYLLETKIKNLELLNKYDKQIAEKFSSQINSINPNLILTNKLHKTNTKGYKYGSSASYFESDCPNLMSGFFDININFFNPDIIKEIAYLRVNISRYENSTSTDASITILNEYYEAKPRNNLIRMSNDFPKGKYEVIFGFIFKSELASDYPTFNFKKCIITI